MADKGLWEGVLGALKTVVPSGLGFLANAILPGSGGIASTLIADVLGCEDEPDSIQSALVNATPEQKTALIAEANRHKEELLKLSMEKDKMEIAAEHEEKKSAREREMAIVKATGKKDWNIYILAYAVVAAFGIMSYLSVIGKIPKDNITTLNTVLNYLNSGFIMVLSYFFGSSKSSSDKNSMIAVK